MNVEERKQIFSLAHFAPYKGIMCIHEPRKSIMLKKCKESGSMFFPCFSGREKQEIIFACNGSLAFMDSIHRLKYLC